MKLVAILLCALMPISSAFGSLYIYPEGKRPAVSLRQACGIAETILAKLGIEKDYYVLDVVIAGDKGQTGAGAWNLGYRNAQGATIKVVVYFPEDLCILMMHPKVGEHSEKGYTRDGEISKKWIEKEAEAQERWRKDEERDEIVFGPAEPKKEQTDTEHAAASDGDKPSK